MFPVSWSIPNGMQCPFGANSRFSRMIACFVALPIFSHCTILLPVLDRHTAHNRHNPTTLQSIRLSLPIHTHLAVHSALVGLFLLNCILFHFFILTQLSDGIFFCPSHRFQILYWLLLNFIGPVLDQVPRLSSQPWHYFKMGSIFIAPGALTSLVFVEGSSLEQNFSTSNTLSKLLVAGLTRTMGPISV